MDLLSLVPFLSLCCHLGREGEHMLYPGEEKQSPAIPRTICTFQNRKARLVGLVLRSAAVHLCFREKPLGLPLVAQWLRIHLPMQGTRVRALVREDPTCCWATNTPQLLSLCSRACKPQLLSPHATTTEACPQQEKPLQWEARTPHRRVAPARCNYRKPMRSNEDPTQPKINK